jgi:intracellular multiplication protein IcmL
MPVKDAIATILNRNSFYRDGYRLLLRISLIQLIVIAVLAACIASLIFTVKTQKVYFATTSDGRIISVVPLNEPYLSDAQVITWAARTARNVMTFDYKDYNDHLQQSMNNFTDPGWQSFSNALKESSIIEAVTSRKLVVSLEVMQAPEIDKAGVINGVYTWHMKFPVTIKFDGVEPPQPMVTQLVLTIQRISTLVDPSGISIQQMVFHNQDERQ